MKALGNIPSWVIQWRCQYVILISQNFPFQKLKFSENMMKQKEKPFTNYNEKGNLDKIQKFILH